MVLYDRATRTFWSQLGGFSLQGPLLGSNFVRGQTTLTKWATWKKLYPNTRVLARPAGSTKNYNADPYAAYKKTDRLIFDSCFESHRTESPYRAKDAKEPTFIVFTDRGNTHLFPISEVSTVLNIEDLDDEYFVLLWDKTNSYAAAYNRVINGTRLSFVNSGTQLGGTVRLPVLKDTVSGSIWNATGACTSGPLRGLQLRRLTSFTTYWAAATSFFPKSQLWMDNTTIQYFPAMCPTPSTSAKCSVPCDLILAAGPGMDAIKSIDSPVFMTPVAFEAIERVPRRTIAFYAVFTSAFLSLAIGMYGYGLYQRWNAKPAAMEPIRVESGSKSPSPPNGAHPTLNGSAPAVLVNGSKRNDTPSPAPKKTASPMIMKEDDEAEPELPPEALDSIPKFAKEGSTPPAATRRRKKKKHGRSNSLVEDPNGVQMDVLTAPLTARGPPTRFSIGPGMPIPRLAMVQPWQHSQPIPEGSSKATLTRNKSDTDLDELEAASQSASSTGELASSSRPPASEKLPKRTHSAMLGPPSTLSASRVTPQGARQFEVDSTPVMTTISGSISGSTPRSVLTRRHTLAPLSDSTLVHRASSQPAPRGSAQLSRTLSGFESALVSSQEYSTSIDSDIPDNYQISLTSVHSEEEHIPEHIMSAAALARIKGQSMKKSPSVLDREVFQPIAEASEPSDDKDDNHSKKPAPKPSIKVTASTPPTKPSTSDDTVTDLDF